MSGGLPRALREVEQVGRIVVPSLQRQHLGEIVRRDPFTDQITCLPPEIPTASVVVDRVRPSPGVVRLHPEVVQHVRLADEIAAPGVHLQSLLSEFGRLGSPEHAVGHLEDVVGAGQTDPIVGSLGRRCRQLRESGACTVPTLSVQRARPGQRCLGLLVTPVRSDWKVDDSPLRSRVPPQGLGQPTLAFAHGADLAEHPRLSRDARTVGATAVLIRLDRRRVPRAQHVHIGQRLGDAGDLLGLGRRCGSGVIERTSIQHHGLVVGVAGPGRVRGEHRIRPCPVVVAPSIEVGRQQRRDAGEVPLVPPLERVPERTVHVAPATVGQTLVGHRPVQVVAEPEPVAPRCSRKSPSACHRSGATRSGRSNDSAISVVSITSPATDASRSRTRSCAGSLSILVVTSDSIDSGSASSCSASRPADSSSSRYSG